MPADTVRIGISTCPNDTFAFAPLLRGVTDARGLDFRFELMDIDELNRSLGAGRLDVGKASFFAALELAGSMQVLPSGSALGFGAGPLLLALQSGWTPARLVEEGSAGRTFRFLGPGKMTTAVLLLRLFYGELFEPGKSRLEQVLFSEIMPALKAGEADFGVCIHEGRFTWREAGLACVEDLGSRWELETGMPLPLGGILVRSDLGDPRIGRIQAAIRDSVRWSLAHARDALPVMREHAQEFSDDVLMEHVRLYVNDWTVELGGSGAAALAELHRRAIAGGLLPAGAPPLRVWSGRT